MTINERVRLVRTAPSIDLTMEKFGERLGVQRAAISKIENGSNKVSDQIVKLICANFSVNETWLRTGSGEMFLQEPDDFFDQLAQKYSLDDFSVAFVKQFMGLEEKDREAVRQFMRSALAAAEAREARRMAMPAAVSTDEMVEIEKRVAAAEAAYEKRSGLATDDMSSATNTGNGNSEAI